MSDFELSGLIIGIVYIFILIAVICIKPVKAKKENRKLNTLSLLSDINISGNERRPLTDKEIMRLKKHLRYNCFYMQISLILALIAAFVIYRFFISVAAVNNFYKLLYLLCVFGINIVSIIIINLKYTGLMQGDDFEVADAVFFGEPENNGEKYLLKLAVICDDEKKHIYVAKESFEVYEQLKEEKECKIVLYKNRFVKIMNVKESELL